MSPWRKGGNAVTLLNRHTFLTLAPDGAVGDCPPEDRETTREWIRHGLPAIVRRPCLSDDGKTVFCGVSLPIRQGKRKIAFTFPVDAIRTTSPPPLLSVCLENTPESAREALRALLERLPDSLSPRVVGSVAWQTLTRASYVTANSDVDLLFQLDSADELDTLDSVLRSWTPAGTTRHDIEIITPSGVAFLWKEYAREHDTLLIKTNHGVALIARAELPIGGNPPMASKAHA